MKQLVVHAELVTEPVARQLMALCPFQAFDWADGQLSVTAACKMCGLCVKRGPAGAVTLEGSDGPRPAVDKQAWRGIAVFADTTERGIHPVTFELLGKARELAAQTRQPVYALLIGARPEAAQELIRHGADEVFVYGDPRLGTFLIEPFTAAFADFVEKVRPSAVLVGATNAGRSLAPRVAARFRTGLTADCTALEIRDNTDLVQIRPAFGGNIMARIVTPSHRPQLCTVRYKTFTALPARPDATGKVTPMALRDSQLASRIQLLHEAPRETGIDITGSEVLMAVGRGIRRKQDLDWLRGLAAELHAPLACTRPLVENGWFDPRLQIGLSGRTVSPKLILTVGISGSVQFVAGMKGAETIIAINADPHAAIFSVAHYAAVGDLYEILPDLVERIARRQAPA